MIAAALRPLPPPISTAPTVAPASTKATPPVIHHFLRNPGTSPAAPTGFSCIAKSIASDNNRCRLPGSICLRRAAYAPVIGLENGLPVALAQAPVPEHFRVRNPRDLLPSPAYMSRKAGSLPSGKWSIVALGSAGVATVVASYLVAIAVALGCLALPFALFVVVPGDVSSLLVVRALLSAFGLVAGLTILWSLVPRKEKVDINGVLIDLTKEKRLGKEIEAIAAALNEPMPSEVYLLGDANAFVMEAGGFAGMGARRIIGLGMPLLQMLTIAQFRAVLAHEFAHYYAGDTRLGPWVYNTRKTIARVYENMGKKSDVMTFLRRHVVVAGPYSVLMAAMRAYWKLFMRITQAISRRQEFRCDELACHIAGSQALIEGLESLPRCQSALGPYWNGVVLPVAINGFQPQLADGFMRFMNAPNIAKATADFLAKRAAIAKASPMDSHPPLSQRVERARLYNQPAPHADDEQAATELPMISLIDELAPLEAGLLKRFVPALAKAELKAVTWDATGAEVYVPMWRKKIAGHSAFLASKTLQDLPAVMRDLREIVDAIAVPAGKQINKAQRDGVALEVLYCAFALCLFDKGWTMHSQPGELYFEAAPNRLDTGDAFSAMKAGKLTPEEWSSTCAQYGIGGWLLAAAPGLQFVSGQPVPEQPATAEPVS